MTKSSPSPSSAVRAIVLTMLDTTWRMFVPTIGGAGLGVLLDNILSIAPVATVSCLVLGTAASIFLITKQLNKVRKSI